MQYNKPPISIADQLNLMQSRGLIVDNPSHAITTLHHVSYYRLRAYTFPFQNNNDPNHPFKPGTTFDDIVETYVFDRKLRLIVFDALEKIEVALRTQLIYQYAMKYGAHWYEDINLYRNAHRFQMDINNVVKEINRSQEQFIKHYVGKYTAPQRPPSWMALEVISLGTLSKLYENLTLCAEKKAISKYFGLGHPFSLESWMHTFSFIRNVCAHHSRLWNRPIITAPQMPRVYANAWIDDSTAIDTNKLYASLCCMKYFLNIVSPQNNFKNIIQTLLTAFPNIKPAKMGFPKNWENQQLWQ